MIRWTQPANDDFLGIIDWITANNRAAAAPIGRRILAAAEELGTFPLRGRPGRSPDTRELVIAGLPYLIIYSVDPTSPHTVLILRVLHGAMLWPLPGR